MLTSEIKQFLKRRFSLKEWSLFFEVVEGVGCIGSSRCDAIAVGHGIRNRGHVVGFEIKASRQDWLKELSQPRKNEFWVQACSEFYVVAKQWHPGKHGGGNAGIVKIEELPEGWGLIDPTLYRSNTVKRATRKRAALDMDLMVYLLRSVMFCREKLEAIMAIIQWHDGYTITKKMNTEISKLSEQPEEPLFAELAEPS